MEISLISGDESDWSGEVLILGIIEEDLGQELDRIKTCFGSSLVQNINAIDFKATSGSICDFHLVTENLKKLVLVGLGKLKQLSLDEMRKAASLGARATLGYSGKLGVKFPWQKLNTHQASKAVCESIRLSLFKDLRFKSKPEKQKKPESLYLIGLMKEEAKTIHLVNPICSGVELARELVGAPPNNLTPNTLAEVSTSIAKEYGLEAKILTKKDCEKKGMGAYLAVAKGSDLEPKFIHLIYRPKGEIKHRLALVGKGLTFDSGGYNLKVGAAQIDLMKFDMGGSAAVIGAARSIGELSPLEVEIHFIVAACENMINGSAVHPGDIIEASNGVTIEINNTDAEGRLTLADALVYASKLKPNEIIDLATLTGACVIALGDKIAGFWTDNDQLAIDLQNASNSSGEGLWRMPMYNPYKESLKSMLADLKNTGSRAAGSITAALFLKEFVDESIAWAHIDIAGPVWSEKESGINPAGATGYGVRTLVEWIINKGNIQN